MHNTLTMSLITELALTPTGGGPPPTGNPLLLEDGSSDLFLEDGVTPLLLEA